MPIKTSNKNNSLIYLLINQRATSKLKAKSEPASTKSSPHDRP